MCINHIMAVLKDFCNGVCCLSFCTVISIEIRKLCFHFLCDRIFAACCERLHQLCTFFCITACDTVDQTFQIAGDQNIHGWRSRKDKITFSVISSCAEEIIQYFIVIGSTDQFMNRKSHLFCIISSQNVSKVSGRYYHIDLLTIFDLALTYQ